VDARKAVTIRAVVFDIGGVLEYADDESWLSSWSADLGLTPGELSARLGRVDPQGQITIGEWTEAEYVRRYREALGFPEEHTERFVESMWDWYCGELDQEMFEFAANLRPAYRTAILSNSADGARREEQARYGFEQLVDEIVYSHEVGLAKPDSRIYDLTCRRMGVQPEEVAFLDDLAENVEAACAVGWHAILHEDTPTSIATLEALLLN
jgi:epoxide hydrolase-like predicted phosphatase